MACSNFVAAASRKWSSEAERMPATTCTTTPAEMSASKTATIPWMDTVRSCCRDANTLSSRGSLGANRQKMNEINASSSRQPNAMPSSRLRLFRDMRPTLPSLTLSFSAASSAFVITFDVCVMACTTVASFLFLVKEATAISSAKLEAAWVGLTPVRVRSPRSIYLAAGAHERWMTL